jgi:glutamate decarboxylase
LVRALGEKDAFEQIPFEGERDQRMKKKIAQADLESLYRVFTVPEAPDSTVGKIDQAIYRNLVGFLQEHIVAVEKDLNEIEQDFSSFRIEDDPQFVSDQVQFLLEKCVAHSVHTAAPSFVGHMTSAFYAAAFTHDGSLESKHGQN